jgi:hypothetical protein
MKKIYNHITILLSCIFFCSCLPELPKCTSEKINNDIIVNSTWTADSVILKTNKRIFKLIPDSIIIEKTGDYSHTLKIYEDTISVEFIQNYSCSNIETEYLNIKLITPSKSYNSIYIRGDAILKNNEYTIKGNIIGYNQNPLDSNEIFYNTKILLRK